MKSLAREAHRLVFGEPKEFDPSRRKALKGAAALAATAVVATASPGLYKAMDALAIDDLYSQIKSGATITNQIFYIDDTLVLENLKNVRLLNCRFVMSSHAPETSPYLRFEGTNSNCAIMNCVFERGEKIA